MQHTIKDGYPATVAGYALSTLEAIAAGPPLNPLTTPQQYAQQHLDYLVSIGWITRRDTTTGEKEPCDDSPQG